MTENLYTGSDTCNQSLKILMLTSSYPKFPGDVTAPFIEALAQNTQQLGHRVTVVMPYHPELKRQPDENGVKLFTYHYALRKSWNIWGYAASLQGDIKVRKLIYLLLPFVLAASFFKMWQLTGRERFDVIQAHWVIPNAPVAVLVGWLRHIPVVISLHGSDVYMAERVKPVGWVASWAFRRAAAVTASSPDLLQRAQKLGASSHPEHSVIIPYGADPKMFSLATAPRFEIREQLGFKPEEKILLCVGRLVYKKGFEYALRALPTVLEKFPEARLVIAGKGDLETELKALAKTLNISEKVRFEGAVPHDRMPDYLSACGLFLLPSVIDSSGNVDGLPNTLLEAMAAARPVIASNVAGVPLAVADGENGRLVPPGNPEALALAVQELLNDPAYSEKLGQMARRKIENELNWTTIAKHYAKVFYTASQHTI
jgi:glycosyltransferase involved in cell wall biosynthesis